LRKWLPADPEMFILSAVEFNAVLGQWNVHENPTSGHCIVTLVQAQKTSGVSSPNIPNITPQISLSVFVL